jgi:flagellar basal-body rod protein FlgB
MFQSTAIPTLEQVVDFAQARHHLLAGNVANIDTPGYRARDLSLENFQQALKEAIGAGDRKNEPVTSRILSADPKDSLRQVKDSIKSILYHDGSDVGLEQQVAEITKNMAGQTLRILG